MHYLHRVRIYILIEGTDLYLSDFLQTTFQMWNEFYWHLLVTRGWLMMASFIPLTFMLWCSFPFPFSDVFPFKRVKNKRKTKGKEVHSTAVQI